MEDLEGRLEQLPWAGDLDTSQQAGIFLLQFHLCPPHGAGTDQTLDVPTPSLHRGQPGTQQVYKGAVSQAQYC